MAEQTISSSNISADSQVTACNSFNISASTSSGLNNSDTEKDKMNIMEGELESALLGISDLKSELLEKSNQLIEAADLLKQQDAALASYEKTRRGLRATLLHERSRCAAAKKQLKTIREFTASLSKNVGLLYDNVQSNAECADNVNINQQKSNDDNVERQLESLSKFVDGKVNELKNENVMTKLELNKIANIVKKLVHLCGVKNTCSMGAPKKPLAFTAKKMGRKQVNAEEKIKSFSTTGTSGSSKNLTEEIHHAEDLSKPRGIKSLHYCICGVRRICKYKLLQHIRSSNGEGKFECEICKVLFVTLSDLKRHQSSKHNFVNDDGMTLGCVECGQRFALRAEFKKHRNLMHSSESSSEATLDKTKIDAGNSSQKKPFTARKYRAASTSTVASTSRSTNYSSVDGTRTSTSRSSTIRQRRTIKTVNLAKENKKKAHFENTDNNDGKFVCGCGSEFVSQVKLKMHIHRLNTGKNIACSFCSSHFYSVFDMRKHTRRIHKVIAKKSEFGCRTCGLIFDTRKLLWQHIRQAHGLNGCKQKNDIKHEADTSVSEHGCVCGKKFGTSFRLNVHLSLYKKSWKFQCVLCKKRFPFESRLRAHMESPSCFTVNTGKRSNNTRSEIKRKRRQASPVLQDIIPIPVPIPLSSDEIRMTVPTSSQKNKESSPGSSSDTVAHAILHSSAEMGQQCTCGMKFNYRTNLVNHVRRKNESSFNYKCEDCEKTFLFLSALKTHIITSKSCNNLSKM